MGIDAQQKKSLDERCRRFRIDVLHTLYQIQTGHPGGSFSVCEILAALYLVKARVDPRNPAWEGRDRIILSKGHAAPMLYRLLAERGFFPPEELGTLRQMDSRLQGHPCALETPGVDLSTGPLGLGLSAGLGMELGLRSADPRPYVYVVLGDGELQEGCNWEAAMSAYKFGADHLIAMVDYNGVQLDGTNEEIMPLLDLRAKFSAFGWRVLECDGHDVAALCDSIDEAKRGRGTPVVILAHTVKGKGVSFMEGRNTWHGKAVGKDEYERALRELGGGNHG